MGLICGARGVLVVFCAAHLANPNATLLSAIAIMVEAGIFLGAAYMLTRRLWLAIGIHAGWNFTEGGIFGVSISGGAATKGIFSVALVGHPLLTGGAFGPEASIVAIVACLAVAAVLLALAVRAGRWLPMSRRAVRSAA